MLPLKPINATHENFAPYGNLFTDYQHERVRIERWPQHPNGFRPVADGVSGGEAEGEFTVSWVGDRLHSHNSAISDSYVFATRIGDTIRVDNEINYHACGSQMFYCEGGEMLLMVAQIHDKTRFPDHVKPTDFIVFRVPAGIGAHINAYVWHCPPLLPVDADPAKIQTRQARVHSKIYYDPMSEDGVHLTID